MTAAAAATESYFRDETTTQHGGVTEIGMAGSGSQDGLLLPFWALNPDSRLPIAAQL